jgi:hypothetical protein
MKAEGEPMGKGPMRSCFDLEKLLGTCARLKRIAVHRQGQNP